MAELSQKMHIELSFEEAMAVRHVLGEATVSYYRDVKMADAGRAVYACLDRHLPPEDKP